MIPYVYFYSETLYVGPSHVNERSNVEKMAINLYTLAYYYLGTVGVGRNFPDFIMILIESLYSLSIRMTFLRFLCSLPYESF